MPGMLADRQLIPSVLVKIRVFNGLRLALARNKPWLAGRWTIETQRESFEWFTKRDAVMSGLLKISGLRLCRSGFIPMKRAKTINRWILTGSSKLPVTAGNSNKSAKAHCSKRSPILCPGCRMNSGWAVTAGRYRML